MKVNKIFGHLEKSVVDIIQINLGDLCNQSCTHCHIEASPKGENNMDVDTAKKIIEKLNQTDIKSIEFTGGAPEMNTNLVLFIEELAKCGKHLSVRTNLTILDSEKYAFYIKLYKKYNVHIYASFPSIFKDSMDHQRGKNTFEKSISVLKKLNKEGFGQGDGQLTLVYNPDGDFLPPQLHTLDSEYRTGLASKYGIQFDDLVAIVNSPIKRFKHELQESGRYDSYMTLLSDKFNKNTLKNLMCRHLLSIDYDGSIYDCDFNLALNMKVKGYEKTKFWDIDFSSFSPEISIAEHCLSCSVNCGSSCQGSLIAEGSGTVDIQTLNMTDVKESVKEYYGDDLKGTTDLLTDACCTVDSIPDQIKSILPEIHDEIKMKYYGCGSPIPYAMEAMKTLDIGCGTGRDVYLMSKLVGENGFVYGIDMTTNQIDVAKRHIDGQRERFGYKNTNVKFIHDYIENLDKHIKKESIDIVTSNCVINLIENKTDVMKNIYDVLKYGGEFYFSDVYVDRRLPDEIRKDKILYGECMGGALYYKDFERMAINAGFAQPRIVSSRVLGVNNKKISDMIGNAIFYSTTYRLWKIAGLEDACEDYGHVAIYRGGCKDQPFSFELDNEHIFEKNKPERVCGNTEKMLSLTRFSKYFEVLGNYDEHFGAYEGCATGPAVNMDSNSAGESCC